jgi:uncharacterized integral membrane protein (TIGR00698 family)
LSVYQELTTTRREASLPGVPASLGAPVGRLIPGLSAAAGVAVVATALGRLVPIVGAPVFAIVVGIAVSMFRPAPASLRPGLSFASKRVLQGSIVVLGLGLSMRQVVSTGESSLPVLAGTLVVTLVVGWLVGRRLRLGSDVTTLVSVGTAVCGASAIAASDAVIGAEEADVSYAVATIFAFNIVAVLLYPTLGHLLGLSQHAFGLWAGTAINDTSSVVAASTVFGHSAAAYGVVVKLTRTLAIMPICLALAWRNRPGGGVDRGPIEWRRVVPMFVLGFLAAVVLNTAGLIPAAWHHGLSDLAAWMITAALAAIGLSTSPGRIRRAGMRPLVLGAVLWATIGITSLGIQAAAGTI